MEEKPEVEKRTFQKPIISEQEKQFNNKIIEFYKEIRNNNYENAGKLYGQVLEVYDNFDQAKKQKYKNGAILMESKHRNLGRIA